VGELTAGETPYQQPEDHQQRPVDANPDPADISQPNTLIHVSIEPPPAEKRLPKS
jgi:hypothetical protein